MDLLGHMKTISSAVEDYIKSKPFLVSALTQGIINLTSLARMMNKDISSVMNKDCLLYTSPSPRDRSLSRMPSSA